MSRATFYRRKAGQVDVGVSPVHRRLAKMSLVAISAFLALGGCAFLLQDTELPLCNATLLKKEENALNLQDGDVDKKVDDVFLARKTFENTIVEIWCIDGRDSGDGIFYAMLVDGVKEEAFRFVGKCAWRFGDNKWNFMKSEDEKTLNGTIWTTTDADGPKEKHKGTGKKWKYTYNLADDSLTAEKLDKDDKPILGPDQKPIKKVIKPAPKKPFKYKDLPSDPDPESCSGEGEFLLPGFVQIGL